MSPFRFAAVTALSLAALATTVPLALAKPPSPKQMPNGCRCSRQRCFDNTTEGIEAEELATLRKTGTSGELEGEAGFRHEISRDRQAPVQ